MNANRILVAACLGLGLAVVAGCDKEYNIVVRNYTSEVQNVQISDSTGFPEREFSVAPEGGKRETTIKQSEDARESYTLKTNKFTVPFTISKQWNDQTMYFHITPKEVQGPVDKNAKLNLKWDDTVNTMSAPQYKVE
jgi:hypothetical protein